VVKYDLGIAMVIDDLVEDDLPGLLAIYNDVIATSTAGVRRSADDPRRAARLVAGALQGRLSRC
jgi:L-amino acid N-acyltransferase YncA